MSRKGNIVQKTAFRRHFCNMVVQEAKIRGGNVEIRKEHIESYKIAHFQLSLKTFQIKLPKSIPHKVLFK